MSSAKFSVFSKIKRRFYKRLWLLRPIFFISLILAAIGLLVFLIPFIFNLLKQIFKSSNILTSWINPSIVNLDSSRGRTNILLLGIGGDEHPGADLTDSLMLISINLDTVDTVLLSLPRDIWVESLQAKLNTAYHYGEEKKPGGGLILAQSAVSEIINQPIHYVILLNFSGFEKAVDLIGGLDINVPHGFTDTKYPIPGKENVQPESDRYQILTFSSGLQHMDGSTALKYIRSRYAQGEEGTDYARAQRQQRIILAFKDKLFTPRIALNPKKIKALSQIFSESVITNLSSATYSDLIKLALRINKNNIRTGILDQGSFNEDIPPLLYNPPINIYGQWVLHPVNNDWQAVYSYIEEIIYQNQ